MPGIPGKLVSIAGRLFSEFELNVNVLFSPAGRLNSRQWRKERGEPGLSGRLTGMSFTHLY